MSKVGKRAPKIGRDGLTIGQRLKALRAAAGIGTVDELAARSKVGSAAIGKLEADGSNEPSYTNGLRLAAALGVSPWAIIGEPEPPVSNSLDEPRSSFVRPQELAAEVFRLGTIADRVVALDNALGILAKAEQLPKTLRDLMQAALEPSPEDQS